MKDTVTHLVGPMMNLQSCDRMIQRCCVCGEKLEDYHPSRIAVVGTKDRHGTHLPEFPIYHLLRVSGDNPKRFHILGAVKDAETLPDDFCLVLVEE